MAAVRASTRCDRYLLARTGLALAPLPTGEVAPPHQDLPALPGTGGRRIHEYKMLLDNIEMFGLKPEGLADYLSIFKYGCPPHAGFAIGPERLTQKVLGLANVKEACLFPRDRRRVRP
jgi:hypothetical protein